MKNSRPRYEPTRDEIEAACHEIQKTWSEADERRHRKGNPHPDFIEIKTLKTGRTEPNALNAIHGFMLQGADSGR